jgi:hypothetical protein
VAQQGPPSRRPPRRPDPLDGPAYPDQPDSADPSATPPAPYRPRRAKDTSSYDDQGQPEYRGPSEYGQPEYGQSEYGQSEYGARPGFARMPDYQNPAAPQAYGDQDYGPPGPTQSQPSGSHARPGFGDQGYGDQGYGQPDPGVQGQPSASYGRPGYPDQGYGQPDPGVQGQPSASHARPGYPDQGYGQPDPSRASGTHAAPPDAGRPVPERPAAERPEFIHRADPTLRPGSVPHRGRAARGPSDDWRAQDPFNPADDDDADLPPWAGLSIHPTRAGGTKLRAPEAELDAPADDDAGGGTPFRRRRGRAAAARLRKSRRRVYIWCGSAIAIAIVVALVAVIHGLPKHHAASSFIQTLQPGEYSTVPSTCTSVSPALLSQYLPGQAHQVSASPGGTTSQCSFTVDHRPEFRVLGVTVQAYQPSAYEPGNGSGTDNAKDAFGTAKTQLARPGRKSPKPPAQLTTLAGLGTQAVSGLQVIHAGRTVTDLVTVVAQDKNLIVTVSLQGQASGGGYGPVSVATLQAGARSVAKAVLTRALAQHPVKG